MSERSRSNPWFRDEPPIALPPPSLSYAYDRHWTDPDQPRYSGYDELWPEHGLTVKYRSDS